LLLSLLSPFVQNVHTNKKPAKEKNNGSIENYK